MSTNSRIFYAGQSVAITNHGDDVLSTGDMVHGAQSVGSTVSFNPEQAFELSQIEIYENIEGTPDVEVTLEKVLDGYPLMYHMATTGVTGTNASGIVARSKERCDVRIGIFDEAENNVAAAAATNVAAGGVGAEVEIYCSGMYVSSVSYNIPVDGSSTESLTLVGNNKNWLTGANVKTTAAAVADFDGLDSPLALGVVHSPSGGVQRREDVMIDACVLPVSIKGVVGTGVGNGVSAGTNLVHIQSIAISTDFSREDVLELGNKNPYYRPAGFPVEVTCDIEAISTSGHFVSAYDAGDPTLFLTTASGNNTQEENIFIKLRAEIGFDLGTKNRLTSATYGGGDAGGGNVSTRYSYSNFNSLDVQHHSHNNVGFQANP
jgi:hypothetical protein